MELRVLLGLLLSSGIVYLVTPVAIRVAHRLEFLDLPAGYKGHRRPTPYLGGAAVVLGFVAAVLLLAADSRATLPVSAGMILLWLLGTADDRWTVSPWLRVLAETGIALALWALDLGWELGLGGAVDLAATTLWLVAVINAFNLFDNMDGAAGTMAGVTAAGLAALGIVQGDAWLATAAAVLAGACLGFLPHNLLASPAKIFLGDGGSMPVGFAVAAIAMIGVSDAAPAWQSLAMALLFVGVPALDTALVVISRTRRGISVLTGGRDHLTHRARSRLQTARAVALTVGSAQAIISVLAIIALQSETELIGLAVALYLVAISVAIVVLDTRLAPEYPAATAATAATDRPPRRRLPVELWAGFLVVPVGIVTGLSPLLEGYYEASLWVPAGLAAVVTATGLAIARPARLHRASLIAAGAVASLGVLSLLSASWSPSPHDAIVEANRILLYAALLGLLLLAVRSDRMSTWLLTAAAGCGFVVAMLVIVGMLGDQPGRLFLAGRLDQPLGYINGQASFFLISLWPFLALAERARSAALAGVGMGGAVLLACLIVLSQSRGVALAAFASAFAALAILPGRTRRGWALIVLAGAVLLALDHQLGVYAAWRDGALDAEPIRRAAAAALVTAVAAGAAWAAVIAVSGGIARGGPGPGRLATAGLLCVVGALVFLGASNADRIGSVAEGQYRAFVHLSEPQGSAVPTTTSRLASGAGNRYDYWRVAWSAFRDEPVRGWGAGNYVVPYFERRRTAEDIRQPHSIQLQALSELGLMGGALLVLIVGSVAWGAALNRRRAQLDARSAGLATAAIGMCTAWLVHTSVDWIHLLPGVTALAVAAAAVLLRPFPESEAQHQPGPRAHTGRRLLVAAAAAGVLMTAGMSLTRQALADHYRAASADALPEDPASALREADRALRLDATATRSYHLKAAALARFGEADAAEASLREALRRNPRDFVTWALLGDLLVRRGEHSRARAAYGQASRLNPMDESLRRLSVNPRAPAAGRTP